MLASVDAGVGDGTAASGAACGACAGGAAGSVRTAGDDSERDVVEALLCVAFAACGAGVPCVGVTVGVDVAGAFGEEACGAACAAGRVGNAAPCAVRGSCVADAGALAEVPVDVAECDASLAGLGDGADGVTDGAGGANGAGVDTGCACVELAEAETLVASGVAMCAGVAALGGCVTLADGAAPIPAALDGAADVGLTDGVDAADVAGAAAVGATGCVGVVTGECSGAASADGGLAGVGLALSPAEATEAAAPSREAPGGAAFVFGACAAEGADTGVGGAISAAGDVPPLTWVGMACSSASSSSKSNTMGSFSPFVGVPLGLSSFRRRRRPPRRPRRRARVPASPSAPSALSGDLCGTAGTGRTTVGAPSVTTAGDDEAADAAGAGCSCFGRSGAGFGAGAGRGVAAAAAAGAGAGCAFFCCCGCCARLSRCSRGSRLSRASRPSRPSRRWPLPSRWRSPRPSFLAWPGWPPRASLERAGLAEGFGEGAGVAGCGAGAAENQLSMRAISPLPFAAGATAGAGAGGAAVASGSARTGAGLAGTMPLTAGFSGSAPGFATCGGGTETTGVTRS